MSDRGEDPSQSPVPPPPKLPEVESVPPEEVLDSVPSPDEVLGGVQSPEEIIDDQPSVDEISRRET